MIGFIIAVIAGFITPYIDAPVSQPLARSVGPHVVLEPGEIRVVSFIITMLVAAILARIFHSGSGVWLVLGGALGYFLLRIVAAIQHAIQSNNNKA